MSNRIQDIVVFEKNLFRSYSDWSPQLKDLLRDSAQIIAFQRRAYGLYKEKFEPGAMPSLSTADCRNRNKPKLTKPCGDMVTWSHYVIFASEKILKTLNPP